MLSSQQRDDVEALIRDVGTNCIAPYFRNLKEGDISFKSSPNDPVSVADKEAENLLEKGLLQILPGSLFIGEESYAADPSIINSLTATDTLVWVTDPIDGTQNFISGREGFGAMLALLYNGEVIASWMYDVMAKSMLICHRGEGVYLNGVLTEQRQEVSRPWRGLVGWKIFKLPAVQNLMHTGTYDMVPAIYPSIVAYGKLLSGELDFLVYKMTSCWDHLPGILMARELGFSCARWSGEPFQVTDLDTGLIVARTPGILEHVRMDIADQVAQYRSHGT